MASPSSRPMAIVVLIVASMTLFAAYLLEGGLNEIRVLVSPQAQSQEKGMRKDDIATPITFCGRTFPLARIYIDGISVLDRTATLLNDPENIQRCAEFHAEFPVTEVIGVDNVGRGESPDFYSLVMGIGTSTVDFPIYVDADKNRIRLTANHILGALDPSRPTIIEPSRIQVTSSPHGTPVTYRPFEKNKNVSIDVCGKEYILWQGIMAGEVNIVERMFEVVSGNNRNQEWFCSELQHNPSTRDFPPEITVFAEVLEYDKAEENRVYLFSVSTWERGIGGATGVGPRLRVDLSKNLLADYQSGSVLGRVFPFYESRAVLPISACVLLLLAVILWVRPFTRVTH